MHTWQQLRELRQAGQSPALMLVIASAGQYRLGRLMEEIGAMVIEHRDDVEIPTELLADLDVLLILDTCKIAAQFGMAIEAVENPPYRMRAYCQCGGYLTVIPDMGCKL